jgi:two-component system LytT family response regulator
MDDHQPPERLTALIVDDEALARASLRGLLAQDPEIEVIGECSGGAEAAARVEARAPDILLLDVQMPEVDGFEVLRRIGSATVPAVVFVTAHDDYALQAFEAEALDYLLKPFDDTRFHRSLSRAKARARERRVNRLTRRLIAAVGDPAGRDTRANPPTAYAERLALKNDGRISFLRVTEIDWIEAADYCVRVHAGGRFHLLRESMRELEARLDPRQFFRIHRSAIVNISRIRELQPYFHGEFVLVMHDGARLKLSRGRREQLTTLLGMSA